MNELFTTRIAPLLDGCVSVPGSQSVLLSPRNLMKELENDNPEFVFYFTHGGETVQEEDKGLACLTVSGDTILLAFSCTLKEFMDTGKVFGLTHFREGDKGSCRLTKPPAIPTIFGL
ncbi:MAG: hypothetical protein HYT43_01820 [Candidatus Taylorbacteria bacterium]|nr:hypothetical protein [Candidatus Taylorbacteria bacterium]